MILARSTKTNARRKECVIEEISAKISLTLSSSGLIPTTITGRDVLGEIKSFWGTKLAVQRNM